MAKKKISASHETIMVVSSRPKIEDTSFILNSSGSQHLRYFRIDEPFAAAMDKMYPRSTPGKSGLDFYLLKDNVGQRRLADTEGQSRFVEVSNLELTSSEYPNLMLAVCGGIGIGLISALRRSSVLPVLLTCLGISYIKLVTACPTCPHPSILGIDATVLGIGTFGLLSAATIAWHRSQSRWASSIPMLIFAALASILTWQMSTWWSVKLQCLPCSFLGFLCSWLVTSYHQWGKEAQTRLAGGWAAASGAVSILVVSMLMGMYSQATGPVTRPNSLVALGMAKDKRIHDVRELGLKPTKRRTVYFVAAKGCHPCESALTSFDAMGIKDLTYAFVSAEAPDASRQWIRIDAPDAIRTTPTTLFVEADGRVSDQISGFRSDPKYFGKQIQAIQTFLSPISKS